MSLNVLLTPKPVVSLYFCRPGQTKSWCSENDCWRLDREEQSGCDLQRLSIICLAFKGGSFSSERRRDQHRFASGSSGEKQGASLGFLRKGQVDTFLQSVTSLPVMDCMFVAPP